MLILFVKVIALGLLQIQNKMEKQSTPHVTYGLGITPLVLQAITFTKPNKFSFYFNFRLILLPIIFCCLTKLLTAQTVTISGPQPVDIGCENEYTANISDVPSSWTIVGYKWVATFVGSNGGSVRYVSGFDSNGNPVTTTETTATGLEFVTKTNKYWVKWGSFFAPSCQIQVGFRIRYYTTDPNNISETQQYFRKGANNTDVFCLKGIPANVTLLGPATVQKCCASSVTYTVTNQGDANSFDQWVYPAGWTVVSQIGNSITLLPDGLTAGTVSCRVGITTACPPIYRNVSIAVSRVDATITNVAAEFPLLRICPNANYTYKINSVCGATSYNWQFPAGWTITSGGATTSVNVTTGSNPQSGNIITSANFTACPAVSRSTPVNPLTGAPPTPSFDQYHNNYHCDAWYVCRNGGTIWHNLQEEAQTYTYTVSSPWRFINASGQAVNTMTLSREVAPPQISLPSGTNRNSGTYTVRANNCLGTSTILSTIFARENDCWCNGSVPYPYQNGVLNPCLPQPPSCGPAPLRTAPAQNTITVNAITQNKVYPNPAKNNLVIEIAEKGKKTIRITSQQGQVINLSTTMQQEVSIDVSNWMAGMYLVEIISNNKTVFTHKLIVNK